MKRALPVLIALLSLVATLPSVASAEQVVVQTIRFVDNTHFEQPRWVTHQVILEDNFIVGPLAPRRPTGSGGSLSFEEGEAVAGSRIELSNGTFAEEPCYLNVAPTSGTVVSGVINPWSAETATLQVCNFQTSQETTASLPAPAPGPDRQPTGKGGTLRFPQGASIAGFAIRFDNGRSVSNCYEQTARTAGSIQDGVIYPFLAEISNMSNCPS